MKDTEFAVEKIRSQYTASDRTELDELKVLGSALGRFAMVIGIPVGIAGIVLLSLAYPLFKHTLAKERKKIAPEILRLTDELLK